LEGQATCKALIRGEALKAFVKTDTHMQEKSLMKTRTIAVANEKGGVGKTVTAINLAAALTLEHKNVLVVDMDPQANASKGLGITSLEGNPSVYDLIQTPGAVAVSDAIMHTAWEGLDLIPGHVDLSGAEVELLEVEGRENRLAEAMAGLSETYDFVLVDTPPSLSLLTVNVFVFARQVLIPCQTHPYAYGALAELCDTVAAVREEINPQIDILGIVPTFYDSRTRVSQQVLSQLQNDQRYKHLIFQTVVRANTTIAESAAAGKPVVFYRKGSFGAIDYNDLAEEVLRRL
jgi:chromosome partitioning protein